MSHVITEEQKRQARSISYRRDEAVNNFYRDVGPPESPKVTSILTLSENHFTPEMVSHGLTIPLEDVTAVIEGMARLTAKMQPLNEAVVQWEKETGICMDEWMIEHGEKY